MASKQWKRYADGCGYCAVSTLDGRLKPWTFASQRRHAERELERWLGTDLYNAQRKNFRIARCIVSEAPRDA